MAATPRPSLLVNIAGVSAYIFAMGVLIKEIFFITNAAQRVDLEKFLPKALVPFLSDCLDGDSSSRWAILAAPNSVAGIICNIILLSIFALQHTGLARLRCKTFLVCTLGVPASLERSLYVTLSGLAMLLIQVLWVPLPQVMFVVPTPFRNLLLSTYMGGWVIFFVSTSLFDHFELFGLRQSVLGQVNLALKQSSSEHVNYSNNTEDIETPVDNIKELKLVLFYKFVRHPMMTGFLIVFWSVYPVMSLGRLVFASGLTLYIFVAVFFFEEPDLVRSLGKAYMDYQQKVPALCPFLPMPSKNL